MGVQRWDHTWNRGSSVGFKTGPIRQREATFKPAPSDGWNLCRLELCLTSAPLLLSDGDGSWAEGEDDLEKEQ